MTNYFSINGYWKDDKTEFYGYIVSDTEDTRHNYGLDDEEIFFYGLSENEISKCLNDESTIHDFVITSYKKIN